MDKLKSKFGSAVMKSVKLKDWPLFYKIFGCFCLVFVFMIILTYITFTDYSNDKEKSILSIISQSSQQTQDKINDYIIDLENITKFPLYKQYNESGDNNTYFYNSFLKHIETFSITNTSNLYFKRMSEGVFNDIFNYKKSIQSVFIFNLNGNYEHKMKYGSLSQNYNPKNEKWFQESIDSFGRPVIISTFKLPNAVDMYEKPVYVFSMARGLVRVESSKVVGTILVNTSIDYLATLCKKMQYYPSQRVLIVDKDNNIIYDTITENISRKLDESLYSKVSQNTSDTLKVKDVNGDFLMSYHTSELTNWKLINIIPINDLNKDIYQMRTKTTLITIILLFFAFILVFLLSKRIANPIKKLVIFMNLVKNGDFNVKIESTGNDEIGILTKTFVSMSTEIKRLINEVYSDKLKQKDLELQMLQNQINPHFLYNTLESISMMAEINDDEETSKMAAALGKSLRYSINYNLVNVTVAEELDHLKDYIMLQKSRFHEMYEITVTVDNSILNTIMIKLILQPIVENAIYHGMSNKRSSGKIEVAGYKYNDNIIFEVTDNGIGMDDDQVNKINDYINGLNNLFSSIGLKNVNKRIKLHYGNEYGLEISSILHVGTKVKVTIPYIEGV